jgi:hypothetical protein
LGRHVATTDAFDLDVSVPAFSTSCPQTRREHEYAPRAD